MDGSIGILKDLVIKELNSNPAEKAKIEYERCKKGERVGTAVTFVLCVVVIIIKFVFF